MITPTSINHLALIPSEEDLAAAEIELASTENYLLRLKTVLAPIRASHGYRAIIIDCPPALGMLSMNSLAAADYLLITLQCEYLALEGLGQILRNVDRLKAAHVNDDLQLGGVVMTMFDMRTNLSRQVVDEVKKVPTIRVPCIHAFEQGQERKGKACSQGGGGSKPGICG
jgi:chromosome partitioning protein